MSQLKKSLIEDFGYENSHDAKSKSSYQQIDLNADKPGNDFNTNTEINSKIKEGISFESQTNFNTLNESICSSIKREIVRIWYKIEYVIIPRCSANHDKNLRNWDLWGPLLFTMLLSYFISKENNYEEMTRTFIMIFFIVWIGGSIVTINSILLGSHISLFQTLCVLGYCLIPQLISSIVIAYLNQYINISILIGIASGAFFWSSLGKILFI